MENKKMKVENIAFVDIIDILFDSKKQKYVKLPAGYTYKIYNEYQT